MQSVSNLRAWAANRRYRRLHYTSSTIGKCLNVLDAQSGLRPPSGEISLVFLTDRALAQLHADFLADPSPTDVITFPGDSTEGLAGEICLSVDRAIDEAAKRNHPFAKELTLYLVHGWLHLAGLDDITPKDRQAMRRAERKMMTALERARALPDFRVGPNPKRL